MLKVWDVLRVIQDLPRERQEQIIRDAINSNLVETTNITTRLFGMSDLELLALTRWDVNTAKNFTRLYVMFSIAIEDGHPATKSFWRTVSELEKYLITLDATTLAHMIKITGGSPEMRALVDRIISDDSTDYRILESITQDDEKLEHFYVSYLMLPAYIIHRSDITGYIFEKYIDKSQDLIIPVYAASQSDDEILRVTLENKGRIISWLHEAAKVAVNPLERYVTVMTIAKDEISTDDFLNTRPIELVVEFYVATVIVYRDIKILSNLDQEQRIKVLEILNEQV